MYAPWTCSSLQECAMFVDRWYPISRWTTCTCSIEVRAKFNMQDSSQASSLLWTRDSASQHNSSNECVMMKNALCYPTTTDNGRQTGDDRREAGDGRRETGDTHSSETTGSEMQLSGFSSDSLVAALANSSVGTCTLVAPISA